MLNDTPQSASVGLLYHLMKTVAEVEDSTQLQKKCFNGALMRPVYAES
jgi:hypothetical protein